MTVKMVFIAFIAAPLHSCQAPVTPPTQNRYSASNCYASDGDTINCGERIRLLGIDAAEMPGHCRPGRNCASGNPHAQKQSLEAMISDRLVITQIKRDHYNREVAIVINARSQNLSCEMIKAGATYRADYDDGLFIKNACPELTN
jgi:micrococcal nuclease